MQQVLVIHGGDAFDNREVYLQSLRKKEITLERLKQTGWKSSLQRDLGAEFDVYTPKFPNSQNARYAEWKIIFEKILPLMDDNLILIGHSLGGIFLAKYLTEETFTKPVKAIFLLAAPYSTPDHEPIVDFTLQKSLTTAGVTGENIHLYHSKDDLVVPFENLAMYQDDLPKAKARIFEDKGHFNMESFPELVEDLKSL